MMRVREQLRTIGTTAVVTSLVWIAGLAIWLHGREPADIRVPTAVRPQPDAATAAADSVVESSRALLIPVVGITRAQLVDTFTQSRGDGTRVHDAIDIMAPRGIPVVAAAPGTVEKLFLSKDGGNTIYIRSPHGRLLYYYAHLDAYAPGLTEGQQVDAGTPLGTVGSTGNTNPEAPHLHFAIASADPAAPWYQQAPPLNPYPWLINGRRPE